MLLLRVVDRRSLLVWRQNLLLLLLLPVVGHI